ncbi:sigma-70 family RNA polymerase sigma factor [Streptomyces sp. rh34]|uniref:sigma-70 family RNA polymerase sigma factor n=1 Tax=Streptomyces sp. rh34 TaxID=2034272 RepID=UPI00117E5734|nr:sigma-70 family RNA polymerase sigma factor [Streptomyces sp. rh34]
MSIVAERPVKAVVTPSVRGGLAEEIERQKGPEPEGAAGRRLSLKEQRRLRGAAIPGNGPGGRRLGRNEDIRMSAEASARMGELCEEYGEGLVHYARRKLLNRGVPAGTAAHLAEEIAQEAWVEVARTGAKDLLAPDAAERYTADETRYMLWGRVKTRIQAHFKRSSSHESPVDWEDPATRVRLCPALEDELARRCQLGTLPGYLAPMVAALPEPEREALLARAYGVPQERTEELLRQVGARGKPATLVARAVLLLLRDNPELSGPRATRASLPEWQRDALGHVSRAQREVLLRLDDFRRHVLLLHLVEGLNGTRIAERLDVPHSRVLPVLSGCAALMAGMTS